MRTVLSITTNASLKKGLSAYLHIIPHNTHIKIFRGSARDLFYSEFCLKISLSLADVGMQSWRWDWQCADPAEHLSCEVLSVQLTVRHRPDVCKLCLKNSSITALWRFHSLSDSQEARKVTDKTSTEDLFPLFNSDTYFKCHEFRFTVRGNVCLTDLFNTQVYYI